MSKEYKVPEEVATLMRKAESLKELRDVYVRVPFGFKKARKLSIEQQEYRSRFWEAINDLYPELKGDRLAFNVSSALVWIADD